MLSPMMMLLVIVVVIAVACTMGWLWINRAKLTLGSGCCGTFGGVEDWEGAHDEAYGGGGAAPVRKFGDSVVFPVNSEEALKLIETGKKTLEARLGRDSYKKLKKGSKVVYVYGDKGVEKSVVSVKEYPNFSALLKAEGFDKVMPGEKTFDSALKTIEGFYAKIIAKGISFDDLQKKMGALAIEVK